MNKVVLSLYNMDDGNMKLQRQEFNGETLVDSASFAVSDEGNFGDAIDESMPEDAKQYFESRIYSAMENVLALADPRGENYLRKFELYVLTGKKVSMTEK